MASISRHTVQALFIDESVRIKSTPIYRMPLFYGLWLVPRLLRVSPLQGWTTEDMCWETITVKSISRYNGTGTVQHSDVAGEMRFRTINQAST